MGRVRSEVRIGARESDAEALWYDTTRWASFVDGFARVVGADPEWPRSGALTWESRPGGRGRVLERVTGYAAGDGQVAEVEDDKLTGRQRVRFEATGEEEVVVGLVLEYRLKRRPPGWQIVDALFIRRAQRDSLTRTLRRLAIEVEAERELR